MGFKGLSKLILGGLIETVFALTNYFTKLARARARTHTHIYIYIYIKREQSRVE